ncbi:vitamin K epoxide reductase family protein, partial [Streptomyces evansiae]
MSKTTVNDVSTDASSGSSPAGTRTAGGSRAFALLLLITGAAGLLAAWVITIDKFKLLEAKVDGKTFTPGCSLNPVVSCGSVMESKQAAAFGFPNPMLGLVAYGIVICVAVTLLARARFP